MNGILNINKPSGKTSFDIVAQVKRLTGEKHVGHAGTLDPAATGVLPICLGQATRVVEYLHDAHKTYHAEVLMGVTTDSYDAEGEITRRADASQITREQLESTLVSFRGVIEQTPPMYSAVKYQGKPLYKLARAGITVERKKRVAEIYDIKLVDWQSPVAVVEITCGKGTYIRSIAHDLGQKLGCGASLKSLIRSRYGPFDIKDAVTPEQLQEKVKSSDWQQLLQPVDCVLSDLPKIDIDEDTASSIKNGRVLTLDNSAIDSALHDCCCAYDSEGHFIAVLRFNSEEGSWKAEKVFQQK